MIRLLPLLLVLACAAPMRSTTEVPPVVREVYLDGHQAGVDAAAQEYHYDGEVLDGVTVRVGDSTTTHTYGYDDRRRLIEHDEAWDYPSAAASYLYQTTVEWPDDRAPVVTASGRYLNDGVTTPLAPVVTALEHDAGHR